MAAGETIVCVLAVSPVEEDHVSLEHVFSHSNWRLTKVRTCQDAIHAVDSEGVPVIICSTDLPDGSWKDLLRKVSSVEVPPRLIVASRAADDQLWAEVLDLGGYDVLGKPFDAREVIRVVSLAWRQWKHDAECRPRASLPASKNQGFANN